MTVAMIIAATALHSEILGRLHAGGFPDPWTAQDFAGFLQQPGVEGWLIAPQDDPAGFILIRRAAEEAEVLTLVVAPMQQRKALGRALVDHVLENLRRRGIAACYLEVAADNTAALALYHRCGFARCATRRSYYRRPGRSPADAIVMRCDL